MRLAMYETDRDGTARPCVIDGDTVRPLGARSLEDILSGGRDGLTSAARQARESDPIPLASVRLIAPLRPAVVVSPGPLLQSEHRDRLLKHREFYLKPGHTVVAGHGRLPYGPALGTLSFRAQVGLVLGRTDRHTSPSQILDNILGALLVAELYSVDLLRIGWEGTMWHVRYGEGASFDASCPVTPVFVTADELDLQSLTLEDPTGGWDVRSDELVEFVTYVNRWMTLGPEMLVLAGSSHGPVLSVDGDDPAIFFPPTEPLVGPGDRIWSHSDTLGQLEVMLAREG